MMFEPIDKIAEWMPIYMMVFFRLSAMVTTMPIIGYRTVSARIRIMFALALTVVIAPVLGSQITIAFTSVASMILMIFREIFIGLIIGFGARLIFEGFAMAGSFIGLQMGMAIMNVFDPSSQQQQPFITQLWMFVMIIFFLVTNSHHFLIETLFQNFTLIHPGGGTFSAAVGQTFIRGGSIIYSLALKFAAPALVFMLLVDISIAFIARVMPQMNVFFISLPLKIGVGIMVLIISLRLFQVLFSSIYNEVENFVHTLTSNLRTVN